MNSKNLKIALIAVAIILIGVTIYFALGKKPAATQNQIGQTTPSVNETANWETYLNSEYGFSFKYPKTYLVTNDDRAAKENNKLLLVEIKYPTGGQSRGMAISISDETLSELMKDLDQSPYKAGVNKMIADLSWKTYSYDPKNDKEATDQSKSVLYILEKDEKLFKISANIGVGLENISIEQADKNVENILSTFQFTK